MSRPAERELLVVRHAKSAWPEGVADRDRPLAGRGERAARRVGHFLALHELVPDRVVSSPARRAVDTARLVLEAAGATAPVDLDERIYGGDARPAVDEALTTGSGAARRLLVVGHEPELAELLAHLTGAQVRLPTAALAWVQFDLGDDGSSRSTAAGEPASRYPARLALVVPPKLLN